MGTERNGCIDARLSPAWAARAPALLASLGLVLGLGCAAGGGPIAGGWGRGGDGDRPSLQRVERPELGAEYDFLVGEMAERDGDLERARSAFQRALTKDPDSAHLHSRLAHLAVQDQDM